MISFRAFLQINYAAKRNFLTIYYATFSIEMVLPQNSTNSLVYRMLPVYRLQNKVMLTDCDCDFRGLIVVKIKGHVSLALELLFYNLVFS